ncbi:type II secretion system protein [Paucibacter sp. DJ1R-11]|uniref:type II secretion system protein n=1 Tax=Paucibacter sp. DJ1R-11 TaxID=2893556 RepID=UPI0021E4156B|nr:hypothetical protein [Paucibacter sp. DJ1R-11]
MLKFREPHARPSQLMRPLRLSSGCAGFGLLEAIIAISIMASVGGALFAWLAQEVRSASRLQEAEQRRQLQSLSSRALSAVNPALQPRGEVKLGELDVRWVAALQAPLRYSYPTSPEEPVRWRVGLYRLQVDALDRRSGQQLQFELLRTGLERLESRSSADGLPP